MTLSSLGRQSTMSKDPRLQHDIERNLRLRDGASKLLALAANSIQRLDAEKTMLVSSARLFMALKELQREKVMEANADTLSSTPTVVSPKDAAEFESTVGRATLCLSDIRIPLVWSEVNYGGNMLPNSTMTLNKLLTINAQQTAVTSGILTYPSPNDTSDQSDPSADSYTAFCIVKVDGQIKETRLLFDIVPGTSDVEFDDVLTFENVSPDFRCIIELYAYPKSSSKPNFLRRKSTFDSMTTSFRSFSLLESPAPDEPHVPHITPETSILGDLSTSSCFSLIARYIANLQDVGARVRAHTMDTLNRFSLPSITDSRRDSDPRSLLFTGASVSSSLDGSYGLPVFGPICFRLTARPHSVAVPLHRGLLWIRALNVSPEQESSLLYDCELRNRCLFARLVAPEQRTNKDAPRSRAKPKWNLLLKIDMNTEIIDQKPTLRSIDLSSTALLEDEISQIVKQCFTKDVKEHSVFPPGNAEENRTDPLPNSPAHEFLPPTSESFFGDENPPQKLPVLNQGFKCSAEVSVIEAEYYAWSSESDKLLNSRDGADLTLGEQVPTDSIDAASSTPSSPEKSPSLNINGNQLAETFHDPVENSSASKTGSTFNSSSSAIHFDMFSFHIATSELKNEAVTLSASVLSEDYQPYLTVYELAAYEPFLGCDGPLLTSSYALTSDWMSSIQLHLREQNVWGLRVFENTMEIPEPTSFTKHGHIIRASAFLENLNVTEFRLPNNALPQASF